MEITGKIIIAMPETSGTSKAGNNWRKKEYVIETQEQYPKKVIFNFFNDNVTKYPLEVGDVVKVSFDLNSREYNGRWYTEVSAWKAESAEQTTAPQVPASQPSFRSQPPTMATDLFAGRGDDDMPF